LFRKLAAFPAMTLLLAACVTINIYFPAAAAEEAARTIVRDVMGSEAAPATPPEQTPPAPQQDDKGAMNDSLGRAPLAVVGWLLETLVPAAEAAEADININTPVVSSLQRSMKHRRTALMP
jgi:hypothetical protein